MKKFIAIPDGPPTYTAQQRRWSVRGGRPVTYSDNKAKAVKLSLQAYLDRHAPRTPFQGPIALTIVYVFPYRKSEKKSTIASGTYVPKDTRPDTDNLMKLLQDVMSGHYYEDDAQIVDLHAVKVWGPTPGIYLEITPAHIAGIIKKIQRMEETS